MNNRAGRPCLKRRIAAEPGSRFFKPRGIPLSSLEVITLSAEELEAFRLRYHVGIEQTQAAESMATSQSTFQRILVSAAKKIADALANGKAIRIERIDRSQK